VASGPAVQSSRPEVFAVKGRFIVSTDTAALSGTCEVPAEAILAAAGALFGGFDVITALAGKNDTAALADPFVFAADRLRGAAFGEIETLTGEGGASYQTHPVAVEIAARGHEFAAKTLAAFGLRGLAVFHVHSAAAIRAEERWPAESEPDHINGPAYLPAHHSETVGFIATVINELGLSNGFSSWGLLLGDVQDATGDPLAVEEGGRR
jgi:hypothetical protein